MCFLGGDGKGGVGFDGLCGEVARREGLKVCDCEMVCCRDESGVV